MIVILLTLLCLTNALKIMDTQCTTGNEGACLLSLTNYIKRTIGVSCTTSQSGSNFLIKIPHNAPPTIEVYGLNINGYTFTNSATLAYDKIYREDVGNRMYIVFPFTLADLNQTARCTRADTIQYYTYQCSLRLDYLGHHQYLVLKSYEFMLSVRIPTTQGLSYDINGGPILENGCDCTIDASLVFTKKLFRQDCVTPISSGTTLTYGDRVCFFVKGQDSISSTYKFDATKLSLAFTVNGALANPVDMTYISDFKCDVAQTSSCTKGQLYAIFDIIAVGRMRIDLVVLLHDRRMLEDKFEGRKGGAVSSEEFNVVMPGEESFGATTFVSIIALFSTLLLLL